MKKTFLLGLPVMALFATALIFFYSSCTTDPCKDVICLNDGVCNSGTCSCAAGYEGTDCSTLSRDKFIGTWNVVGNMAGANGAASGPDNYTATITASSTDVTKVLIANMWGAFTNATVATIDGNTITIALQQPDNDGFTVEGSGTISGTTISMQYTVKDTNSSPNPTEVCTGNWTLQ